MRELLLLDLAGFGCGVWKEDILSHEEQIIHWLTDNNGAATAIAMMGGHPVSLADLSYCIGLAPAVRAKRHPVLVPAGQDVSVSFVVEQEAGMTQVPSSAVFSLPPYLQSPFIDSCVQLNGKLVPLINIGAIHYQLSHRQFLAPDSTAPAPHYSLPVLQEKKEERAPSLAALRVFTCNEKSFAASADYFSAEQTVPAGVLTGLPLMPEFVRGITLHNKQVLTVFDISRYLQLSLATENEEKKWLIGAIAGQGFAFVIDADQGLLPAADSASTSSTSSACLAALPLLVRSDWQQRVAIHDRKIIPVLDLREMLVKQPDECSQALPRNLRILEADGRFEAVFGKQQIEIVEFSLCKMVHALPDLEVADIIPFSHCQRLAGTRGLVAGVTLYRKELLPVLDPARCYGRESRPVAGWKLLLVCNGTLRVLVLAEEILGKRSLNVSEQRALPFTAPHSSVYGCYPVAGRVGLVFNILALTAYFDDQQINELFFFADDLLPRVDDVEEHLETNIELNTELNTELNIESNFDQGTQRILSGKLPESGEPFSFFEEQEDESSLSPLESSREDLADNWGLERNSPVLLTEEQDTLVQSVVASMLSQKKDEATCAVCAVETDHQDDDAVSSSLEFTEEPEGISERVGDIWEELDDVFPSVVAALLSQKETPLDEIDSESGTIRRDEEETPSTAETSLEASPVLLTDEQDCLITSALASMLLRKKEGEKESPLKIHEKQEGEQGVDTLSDDSFLNENELQAVAQLDEEDILISAPLAEPLEGSDDDEDLAGLPDLPDLPVIIFTEEQDALLQSSLDEAFHQEKEEEALAAPQERQKKRLKDDAVDEPRSFSSDDAGLSDFFQNVGEIFGDLGPGIGVGGAGGAGGTDGKDGDFPGAEKTNEQPVLLKQSNESRGVDSWLEALPDFQEEGERSIEGEHDADALNVDDLNMESFPSAPEVRDDDKGGDVADSADEQPEQAITIEFVPYVEIVEEIGGDLSQDIPVQLEESEEASPEPEPETWNAFEDAEAFPELKDFARQVSETQQADSPLTLPHADFVKNVTFPPLFSPDPRRIKEKLDKKRRKEQAVLFRDTAPELKERLDAQSKNKKGKCSNIWFFLLFLGLLSGFLLWFFVFRNQEISHGNSVKPEPQLSEVKREASPLVQGAALEKREKREEGEQEKANQVAEKNSYKSTPASPVVSSPVLLKSELESEPESVVTDQEEAEQEEAEQEVLVEKLLTEEFLVEKALEAPIDPSAQIIFERTVTKNVIYTDNTINTSWLPEDLLGETGATPESVSENNGAQQRMTEEAKQPDGSTVEVEVDSGSTKIIPAISAASTERGHRDGDQEKIIGVELTLSKERTPSVDQKKSPLMSPVKTSRVKISPINGMSERTSHTVSKGDTLWKISEQYTGSGFNYPDVAKKNKIANPDMIYPNQQVTLPAEK
ncbi:MAG: chemotaxis protein CheW [Candidatus Electrothrix sp.]